MRLNKLVLALGIFLFIVAPSGVLALSNPSNNWQANQPTFEKLYASDMTNFWPILSQMENDQCNATSDFIVGIPPGGCTPGVVRSDLLEEQNVPVFCQLYAVKVNPLIKVSSIKSISFKGDYPEGVRSVVFHPARAAVKSYTTLLGDPTLNNIGYAVIILNRNKVEANMTKWIAGNLTATIKYEADEAYGTGAGDYYLPVVGDDEWQTNYVESSFWNGRGYLRASSIDAGSATIQLLTSKDKVVRTFNLKEGETSSLSYLPGYYCKAGLKVKLDSLTVPENKALLNIDGQTIWVRDGARFLNNKCSVSDLNVEANNEGDIKIRCSGAGKINTLSLTKNGAVFKVNGEPKEYHTGERVGSRYLIYYDTFFDKEFVVLSSKNPSDKERSDWSTTISKAMSSSDSFSGLESEIEKISGLTVAGIGSENFEKLASEIKEAEYVSSNAVTEGLVEKYFKLANESVDELVDSYRSELKESGEAYGEEALYEQIKLAGDIGKFKTKAALMDLFIETYPSSKIIEQVRRDRQMLNGADFSKSFTSVYVGDKFHSISIVDFRSVDEGDRKVDLRIGRVPVDGLTEGNKTKIVGGELTVGEILPGKVKIVFNSDTKGVGTSSKIITEGQLATFEGVDVYVKNIEVNEVAHVSLIPEVRHTTSKADFTFRIGVEKRAIQLSPEKTKQMLKNINASIVEWQGIVDRLGEVVRGLKGACFATSAILMIKNMASGMDGSSMARQRVMEKYKGICDTEHSEMSHTECYNKFSNEIEQEVVSTTTAFNSVNKDMGAARAGNVGDSGGLFGGKGVVDNAKYKKDLQAKIGVDKAISVDIGGGQSVEVPVNKIDSISQLQEVMLCEKLGCNEFDKAKRDSVLRNTALGIQQKKERGIVAAELTQEWGVAVGASNVVVPITKDTRTFSWTGQTGKDYGLSGDDTSVKVQAIRNTDGKNYLALLSTSASGGIMGVDRVYERSGSTWQTVTERPSGLNDMVFSSTGTGQCSNSWPEGKAAVSYYEYGNNKGLPAIVPFDLNDGWYAMVPNSGGTFLDSSPQGYTASADVHYFKICNIGQNKLMQSGTGDDLCQTFDVNTAGNVETFIPCPKKSASDVSSLYGKAREAIRAASNQHGQKSINIFNQMMSVGQPMSQLGGFECQDFMSPADCKLMFNVCDPVICPPSRCDLGGKMPVSDVIQTGVIGSLALCLPNAKEGVMIPICLSGVQAGLDSYLSILKSEASCLQQSLDSGEHVGICDEITSIYKCEFFWRQLSPVMDQLLPSVVSGIISPGQRVRGGGEYALVQHSWNTMQQSASYFKDIYAQNAFRAFNIRSTEELGSTFCNAFVGTSVPGSANVLDSLLEPESPSQFYAQVSETLFSEATAPATSQYKVYYHIYAGKDIGTQYKVYLKNPPASSYYASNPTVDVKSGYIAKGSSADETVDFTAPSGYKELCVVINAKEECGFKQVTTDFGLDYVKEKFTQEQAEKEDITSEKECVSGSSSALSMVSLNLQSGAEEMASPDIALRGIIRVCASNNPTAGVESNGSRWRDVGYCGDSSMRCWLDTDSVKDDLKAISAVEGVSNKILDENNELITAGSLNLEEVRARLSAVREAIKILTTDELKDIKEDSGIINALNGIIGVGDNAGAGTNVDRAEALALKATVYRMGVVEAKKSEIVKVIEGDVEESGVGRVDESGGIDSACDAVCVDYNGGGNLVGSSGCGVNDNFETDGETSCCCHGGEKASSTTQAEIDLSQFSSAEGEVINNAFFCEDCGRGVGNVCEVEECDAIAKKIGSACEYSRQGFSFFKSCNSVIQIKSPEGETKDSDANGDSVTEDERSNYCESASCGYTTSSMAINVIGGECRENLGVEVSNIVSEVIESGGVDVSKIEVQTGFKSLSCLVLAQAMQESCLSHCKFKDGESQYNYCDGKDNYDLIVTGDSGESIGIMQLVRKFHEKIASDKGLDIYSFEGNIKYGVNYLIDQYEKCGGDWAGALTAYNAGPGNCNKNSGYSVSILNEKKDQIEEMFPSLCGGTSLALYTPGKLPNVEGFAQVVPIYS